MNIIGLILLFVVNTVLANNIIRYNLEDATEHFEEFIKSYNKEYDEAEKAKRFNIFVKNLEEINHLNERSDNAVYGITQFSDLTKEEFIQQYTGHKSSDHDDFVVREGWEVNLKSENIPSSFDWRDKGVVTPVKNQGQCRSCWAFSIIGNVESAYAIKHNKSIILSEQQLVDCSNFIDGCVGGFKEFGCKYLQEQGSMTEDSYPNTNKYGLCKYNKSEIKVKVGACLEIPSDENKLVEALLTIGPLSIGIDASGLMHYKGGLVSKDSCKGSKTNHEALLVGYGIDNGTEYWLVKNSWGTTFGEQGYFRMPLGINCLLISDEPATAAIISN